MSTAQISNPLQNLDNKFETLLTQFENMGDLDEESLSKMKLKYAGLDEDAKIVLIKQLNDSLEKSSRDADYINEYSNQRRLVEKEIEIEAETNALLDFYIEKNEKEVSDAQRELKSLEIETLNNEKLYNLNSNISKSNGTLTLDQLLTPTTSAIQTSKQVQTQFPNSSNIRATTTKAPAGTNRIPLPSYAVSPIAPTPSPLPPQPAPQQPPRVFSQTQQGRLSQFQPPIPQPPTLIRPSQPPTQIPSGSASQPLQRPWKPEDAFVRPPSITPPLPNQQIQPPNQNRN